MVKKIFESKKFGGQKKFAKFFWGYNNFGSKNIWVKIFGQKKNLVKIIWVRNFLAKKTGRVTIREGFKKKIIGKFK